MAPIRILLEAKAVQMREHLRCTSSEEFVSVPWDMLIRTITCATWISIIPPSSSKVTAFLDDNEVMDVAFEEIYSRTDACEYIYN